MVRVNIIGLGLFLLTVSLGTSCSRPKDEPALRFTLLPSSVTGVDFSNTITENDSLNMFVNEYTYMGGGVGVGDFNKDGLPDLFFTGSQVSSRLYLNKGNFHFEDITSKAHVSTDGWCTGVSIVDINNDGWPDIYVCVSGKSPGARRRNLLFINQHDLTFKEEAAEYGLADTSYSTQAVFFDYDHDGRPDMYLVNHTLDDPTPNNIRDRRVDSNAVATDKLYHNEGVPPGKDHPVFKDVSKTAGIIEDGNGLGVAIADFNGDGYPDIYVDNDYIRNDLLWLNNGDGTFTNVIASAVRHQSYSSMGADAADINNDGLTDLITLDMQPETNERKKTMHSFLSDQRHQLEMDRGYEPQYIHNMLQLNNGVRKIHGRSEPFFSEIGEMAGLAETDWSWSVLIADFDNDGFKDVHITNGLGRDATNTDFLEYARNTVAATGIPESDLGQRRKFMERLSSIGPLSLRNYLFRNNGGLAFQDVSESAGITETGVSNGAVYVDLDNDGDLDVVTNNINGPAFIRRNDSDPKNYLTIRLTGDSTNREGIGTTIDAWCKGQRQRLSEYPVRGYLSSVDSRLHFGFGHDVADSVKITWPDGRQQFIPHPAMNRILFAAYPATDFTLDPADPKPAPLFVDATRRLKTDFRHRETFFFDYQFQPLILQKYSQEGPFISTGDLNGDGLEDFFIGGAFKQSGRLFFQNRDGSFTGRDLVTGNKYEEDMQSVIFDANGDKNPDLLVLGGSSEFDDKSAFYRPRLYLGDGRGNLRLDSTAFSADIRTPVKCLAVADIDGDGDMDVFIGGRVSLGSYPQSCASYLLRNDHGRFVDVTGELCPALRNAGMLNAAVFTDIDGDGRPDLIVAGDWMPIRIFHNTGRGFQEITGQSGLKELPGFWRSLLVTDIDHDGHPDIVAGNLGLNNPFHIRVSRPAELVAKDFDRNGIVDPILCYYLKGMDGKYRLSTGISRDSWARQMPGIKKRYENNEDYAHASMDEVLTPDMMSGALVLEAREVRSGYFQNDGHGHFNFHPFPLIAQVAPVNAVASTDVDGDGVPDLILAGNEYQAAIITGRYDASYGLLLRGDGHGGFNPVPPAADGLILDGDVRDIKLINAAGHRYLLTAINDQPMRAYRLSKH